MNSAQQVPLRGELASTPVAAALRTFEAQAATGRVKFETEIGNADVVFHAGSIIQANVGGLTGRAALFRLLGLSEGSFEFQHERVAPGTSLTQSVAHLLADQEGRMAEWRSLSERAPPMSSVLTLSPPGKLAVEQQSLAPAELTLLALVDGRRTIAEIIDASGGEAVDALGMLLIALQTELLSAGHQPQGASLFPLPSTAAGPAAQVTVPRPGFGRRTVMGIGPLEDEPFRPKAPARQIISVGSPAQVVEGEPAKGEPAKALASTAPAAPQAPESTRGPGRHVGRYEVLFRIGFGGMGSVYLARLNSEGGFRRLFALKLLRSQLTQDSAAAQRFTEEARLAGQIHHPNVVSVVDAGLHGSQPYLVMEYIEGASLKQLLMAHETTRPPELILPIIIEGLTGLHAAHTLVGEDGVPLNIVHCDVSPENLIVGIDGVCRLADFGVARYGSNVRERRQVTHGKPAYLAPEQILGGKIDARADVFAMGVVLYNAITGVKLFDAPTAEETLQRVCTQRIDPPSTVGLRPSPAFDFVCMRALEREPARRFASAEEMMIELRRLVLRENLLSPPSAIASWVRETMGTELAQRRLALLDASRKVPARFSNPPAPEGGAKPLPGAVAAQQGEAAPVPSGIGSEPPPSEAGAQVGLSQTIVLPSMSSTRRAALIVASILAVCAILGTLIWPNVVSRMFRLNIDPSSVRDLPLPDAGVYGLSQDAGADMIGAPSASAVPAPPPAKTP